MLKVVDKGKDIDKVFRFLPKGKVTHVTGTRKWSTDVAIERLKYKINNANTIQYGSYKYVVTFDDKFTYFKGKSKSGKATVHGKLVGRFKLDDK